MKKKTIHKHNTHKKKRVSKQKKMGFDLSKELYMLSGMLLVVTIFLFGWFFKQSASLRNRTRAVVHIPTPEVSDPADTCAFRHEVTGICVESAQQAQSDMIAVMIENHIDARPLSGLSKASVVYEAPVEGHITRFMVLFDLTADVPKVGPVRSARPYFLDLVSEYADTMYMHVGGSPEALENIIAYDLFDMNEFYRGWYFWRDTARYAPHNAYTSSKLWNQAFDRYKRENLSDKTIASWKFGEVDHCQHDCVEEVTVTFRGSAYAPTWTYNSSTEQYERSEYGVKTTDTTGERIVADTLIVQEVTTTVLDSVGRLKMNTVGGGDVTIYQKGQKITGVWKKEGRTERTRFYDQQGNQLELNPGTIWVHLASQHAILTQK